MASRRVHQGPHKYQLVRIKKLVPNGEGGYSQQVVNHIYKCMLPNCTHFMPQLELALGQLSLCWGNCGNAIKINELHLHKMVKKPICENCKEIRKRMRERFKEAS